MKVSLTISLYNEYGEDEGGGTKFFTSVSDAVNAMSTFTVSGGANCSSCGSFRIYDDDDKVVYSGDWDFLKQLFEIEKENRDYFKKVNGDVFSEEDLLRFLYKSEIWVISRSDVDDYEDQGFPIGYFEGSQRQVIDYVHKRNDEDTDSRLIYDYVFVDKLN